MAILNLHVLMLVQHTAAAFCLLQNHVQNTGWGKITSINFNVNNKTTIRDTKILVLNSETTIWEVLNHIVLKEYLASCGRCLRGVWVQSAWETAKWTV